MVGGKDGTVMSGRMIAHEWPRSVFDNSGAPYG